MHVNRKKCIVSFPSPPTGYVHSYWYIICLCSSLPSVTNCNPAASLHPPALFTPSHFLAVTPAPCSASKPEPGHALLVVHTGSARPPMFWHLDWSQDSLGVPTAATVHNSEPPSLSAACPLHPHAQVCMFPAAALRYHCAVSQTCSPAAQGLQQCIKPLRLQFLSPNASSRKVRDLDTGLFSSQLMEGDRNSWAQRWSSRWTSLLSKGVCPPPTGTSAGWH